MNVTVEGVEAKELKFHSKLSGSFTSTAIDTDEEGSKAVFTTLEGVGSFGRIAAQGVGEWSNLQGLVNCPAGTIIEAEIVTARGVLRAPDGDLLYSEFSSGTSCTDPLGMTSYTTEGTFIGGTGRFTNATGTVKATGSVNTLVSDPQGNAFGSATAELTGTIITP
jgi:hypothetical protein